MNAHALLGDCLLTASTVFPCLLAIVFFCRFGGRPRFWLFPIGPLPAFLAALFLVPGDSLEIAWVFFGGSFGIDPLGRVFLLFTSLLWLVAGLYALFYFARDRRFDQFAGFFLLSQCGNLGLILAEDMLSFYLFYSLMSFAAYGLVVHCNDTEAKRAGRVYLTLAVLGEVLLFAALAMLADNAGTLKLAGPGGTSGSDQVIVLLLISFGIKAGALPLHFWLPLAHPVAPAPASAVLSGAMLKAGLLGWLRFLPLAGGVMPEWGPILLGLGLFAAFAAVVVGVCQDEAKTVLAYSSISQMGLLTVGLGCGLLAPPAWSSALTVLAFASLHHALSKGALFLGAGVMARVRPRGPARFLVFGGLLFPALSLAGLPLTAGALAKHGLAGLAAPLPAPWPVLLPPLLSGAAMGTALLMARFLALCRAGRATEEGGVLGLGLVWAGLLLLLPLLPWLWVGEQAGIFALHGLWPVAVGATIGWGCRILAKKGWLRSWPRIPAGDIVRLFERVSPWVARLFVPGLGLLRPGAPERLGATRLFAAAVAGAAGISGRLGHYERVFKRWSVVGVCYLALILLISLLG
ncbi:complex I subunit 5 family protein [Thiovibrio sp. JS02]